MVQSKTQSEQIYLVTLFLSYLCQEHLSLGLGSCPFNERIHFFQLRRSITGSRASTRAKIESVRYKNSNFLPLAFFLLLGSFEVMTKACHRLSALWALADTIFSRRRASMFRQLKYACLLEGLPAVKTSEMHFVWSIFCVSTHMSFSSSSGLFGSYQIL